MTQSNHSLNPNPPDESQTVTDPTVSANSMGEYYQLTTTLLIITLVLMGIITLAVWYFYALNTALNYLLGACVGIVYLKMLAKDVEQLGTQKKRMGRNGLILFSGLIIVATRWQQLHIIPVFLGFLTYKVAIIIYMVQSVFGTTSKVD